MKEQVVKASTVIVVVGGQCCTCGSTSEHVDKSLARVRVAVVAIVAMVLVALVIVAAVVVVIMDFTFVIILSCVGCTCRV